MAKKAKLEPRQLKHLETKFLEFLEDVSLRGAKSRRRGRDGLYHLTLRFQGKGARLEEPNCYGYYFSRGKSKALSLQWGDDALDGAVVEAQKLCPNVSADRIRTTLRDLMIKMFQEQAVCDGSSASAPESTVSKENRGLGTILEILDVSGVGPLLLEAIQQLGSLAVKQIVYVPIEGLHLLDSMTIGDVVLHQRGDQSELDQAIAVVGRQDKETVAYAYGVLKNATCYATVELVGDDEFARNEATKRVRQALHILNFCLSSPLYQPSWDRIRICGIVVNKRSLTGKPIDEAVVLHESYPGGQPLNLSRPSLPDAVGLDEQHLGQLLACYQTSGDIAKRLQRAITWYSKAVDADTAEEQFVDLAIALESLLVGDEGKGPYATTGSITQNLAERVAFLLEDDFEKRWQRAAETRSLYDQRGAIVHRGARVAEDDLDKMDKLVKQVTLAFLRRDFESWPAFQEWIAKQKFSRKL